MVPIIYGKLSAFCYSCGRVGHSIKTCTFEFYSSIAKDVSLDSSSLL